MTIQEKKFIEREAHILQRIQKHYKTKLGREIPLSESKEIASNLLNLAKVLYGKS